jgi:signal transduction histidine kinase
MNPLKILITEDDEISAMLLKKALNKNGHEVVGVTASGEDTLELLNHTQVDLVFMDIKLSGNLDGIKTTELINARQNIPVVYLSSSSDDETLKKVVGTNPSAYVLKPFNVRELNTVIELAIYKHRKELELQRLNNELEEKVKQRTADLNEANKELTRALQKEREIGELKSRIVQNVSHGFKTPLTSILSSAQLLQQYAERDHPFKAKMIKHTQKIEFSVRTLNNLLTSVLFFGKADADKISFRPKVVKIEDFIKEVLDVVNAGAENDVEIMYTSENLPKNITTDEELLYQIIENLLSNAVKYSKDGQKVEFKMSYVKGNLTVIIKDQGIGIPEEEREHLFSRFFRAKNVGIIEGSGLGLSIVKKCVDVLKGEILCDSKAGQGTTFTISIPVS